jgi:hypothetical protein
MPRLYREGRAAVCLTRDYRRASRCWLLQCGVPRVNERHGSHRFVWLEGHYEAVGLYRDAGSAPMLPALLSTTVPNFSAREVSGDREFGSQRNYDAIEAAGATPFIPFKSTDNGNSGGLWARILSCPESQGNLRFSRQSRWVGTLSFNR